MEGPQEVLNSIVAAKNSLVDSEEAEPEMPPEEVPVVVHAEVDVVGSPEVEGAARPLRVGPRQEILPNSNALRILARARIC